MSDSHDERTADRSYALLDFGGGRKLERFGGRLFDRPSPAAEGQRKQTPQLWAEADSVFHLKQKAWEHRTAWPEDCRVDCGVFEMPIFPTPFGHVGVFPEQAGNWNWLSETAPNILDCGPDGVGPDSIDAQTPSDRSAGGALDRSSPTVEHEVAGAQAGELNQASALNQPSGLNLFAYTGASTIAMACSGMKVAHVDAARPNVVAARAAAESNGLADHPIRYLVDDAAKFVARENRRGNRYHTIVLDPPAYGHSPSGKAWRLERDLWPLIDDCLTLLTRANYRLLITGHSPQVGPSDVVNYLTGRIRELSDSGPTRFETPNITSGRLSLIDLTHRKLDAGFYVRCHGVKLA